MKPILIDTLHVHMSGALAIVNHLVDNLVIHNVDIVLIKDCRAPKFESENSVKKIKVMPCSELRRKQYYQQHKDDFHCVLCMGNVPPAIKMPCKVYTYFHNVSLIEIPRTFPKKTRILFTMKFLMIRFFSKNSDAWIVQTLHTRNLVHKCFPNDKIYVMPIYKIPSKLKSTSYMSRKDYVFVGEFTGAKGHDKLLEAWEMLSGLGYDLKLHLTVSSKKNKHIVDEYIGRGLNIENHGFVSFDEVVHLYHISKAIVYPSLNESLGLGLIEGIEAGCDVIGANLPYTHSVCKPSLLFDPKDSQSIAEAVAKYEEGNALRSQLLIKDEVDALIRLLTSHL